MNLQRSVALVEPDHLDTVGAWRSDRVDTPRNGTRVLEPFRVQRWITVEEALEHDFGVEGRLHRSQTAPRRNIGGRKIAQAAGGMDLGVERTELPSQGLELTLGKPSREAQRLRACMPPPPKSAPGMTPIGS